MLALSGYRQLTKTFFLFVAPSVAAQLLSCVYTIVDGYYIGRGIGEAGIAAVGLAFPFTLFITALGTGIGVGGGALISIAVGRKRKCLAGRILGVMVFLAAAVSVFTAAVLTPLCGRLLSLYGVADPAVAEMARLYLTILFLGSPAQVVSMAMLGAVRNDGFPRKAMYIMVAGFLLNIFLDWLLVIIYPFGIAGAALATALSQLLTACLLTSHFLTGRSNVVLRRNFRVRGGRLSEKVLIMGLPPMGAQIAAAVSMLLHNWQALVYGGDTGVAAYSVVAYVIPVGVMLQEGVADGAQPILSYCHGACFYARRRITARLGFLAALVLGLACSALTLGANRIIPGFFSLSGETADLASRGILFSAAMFPFMGAAKFGASYFQSVGRLKQASFLTYGDPFALLPLFLFTLPPLLGMDGVWLAATFAHIALSAIFMVMWRVETGGKVPLPAARPW